MKKARSLFTVAIWTIGIYNLLVTVADVRSFLFYLNILLILAFGLYEYIVWNDEFSRSGRILTIIAQIAGIYAWMILTVHSLAIYIFKVSIPKEFIVWGAGICIGLFIIRLLASAPIAVSEGYQKIVNYEPVRQPQYNVHPAVIPVLIVIVGFLLLVFSLFYRRDAQML